MTPAKLPETQPFLQVRNLSVRFEYQHHSYMAIQNVSFDLNAGQTLALVGESGSGKTITALTLLDLLPKHAQLTSGEIFFEKINTIQQSRHEFQRLRGKHIAMIFQEPVAALNPVFQVGIQITDVIKTHLKLSSKAAKKRTIDILGQVGLQNPHLIYRAYPHQLSGGMAQRVMIAMALSCQPQLIIADEPTTALDVISQLQILKLISELQQKHEFALLLISHDISVVSALANSIMVMHSGRIIEKGQTRQLLTNPRHKHTRQLINSRFQIPIKIIKDNDLWQVERPSLK